RGGCGRAQEIRIRTTLRHIFGGSETQAWGFLLRDIVRDCQQLEGSKRTNDRVDLVALDQFLRFRFRAGWIAAGISRDEFNLAAGECVVFFLQEGDDALFHLNAALRERAGLHGEQAELEWRRLCDRRSREFESRRCCASGCAGHKSTTRDLARHYAPPSVPRAGAHVLSALLAFYSDR